MKENQLWRQSGPLAFPWVKTLDNIMQKSDMPRCDGSLLLLASDYSGFEKGSNFTALSFIVADLYNSNEWEAKRRIIRQQLLPNNRRMSFKGLSDKHRRKALVPFLESADSIEGLLVTFLINKKVKSLAYYPGLFSKWKDKLELQWNWSESQFVQMLNITHFAAILIGALGKDNQSIYWISDQDEIFANQTKHQDVGRIMSGLGNIYIQHTPGELGVGTSEIDPGDRAEEDLIAIADLAAGALVDVANQCSKNKKWNTNHDMILIEGSKPKAQEIIMWLGKPHHKLKKNTIVFDESNISNFSMRKLDLKESLIIV